VGPRPGRAKDGKHHPQEDPRGVPSRSPRVFSAGQSAVLSELRKNVYTVEIVRPLAIETDAIYRTHQAAYPEFGNINSPRAFRGCQGAQVRSSRGPGASTVLCLFRAQCW
jgi:hypothetical protein